MSCWGGISIQSTTEEGQEKKKMFRGARVVQLVGQASDFGSGHDLRVREFEPHSGLSAESQELASDSLSPSLVVPSLLMRALSQK